ncbi:response regulator [Variovorax sp. GT1P44]|uniref:response regulator n=1 Tax=Variovorax sp. GT1P44 TaxID=3443742 RepID=UPI003F47D32A
MPVQLVVAVVDDDVSVREALPLLLEALGFASRAFASAEAFLASDEVDQVNCLLLDVTMPGMSGPELLRELRHRGKRVPVVFMTARADKRLRQRLRQQGAIECLLKPFSEAALLQALRQATSAA